MYSFTEINRQANKGNLPSVALRFKDKYLENEIEGYQTLRVAGRETIGNEYETEDLMNGVAIIGERTASRVITVEYRLKERDNYLFQKKFKQLRKLLTTTESVWFSFADEPDAFYFGRLADMDAVSAEKYDVVSNFTLICESSFKYSSEVSTTGLVTVDTFYKTLPTAIELNVTKETQVIEIKHNGLTIRLNDYFSVGDNILIDFAKSEVYKNGINATYMLALNSDFENFYLEKGKSVTSTNGTIKLKQREGWL